FVSELPHGRNIIVNSCKQHTLIAQRNAMIGQAAQRFVHFEGQLTRMIDVDAHPERMVLLKHLAELRRDALREKDGPPCADSDKLNVRNGPDTTQQFFKLVVREDQGIPTGEKHVTHLGVLLEIRESVVEIRVQLLFAGAAYYSASGAITTIRSATIRYQEEDSVRVPMDQARHRHMAILPTRIRHFPRCGIRLLHSRDNLSPNRTLAVLHVDQIEEVRR